MAAAYLFGSQTFGWDGSGRGTTWTWEALLICEGLDSRPESYGHILRVMSELKDRHRNAWNARTRILWLDGGPHRRSCREVRARTAKEALQHG